MGTIKVRSAPYHACLWFHVEFAFATGFLHPAFRTDGLDKKLNRLLGIGPPWHGLTDVGSRITQRILRIKYFVSLEARPEYFSLDIKNEKYWAQVLPEVVKIIREESKDPTARVVPHEKGERWHKSLLRGLAL